MSVLLCKSGEQGRWPLDKDPTGWFLSEKLDGCRARREGNRLYSRNNLLYPAPPYFFKGFPDMPLDGELWLGRKMFEETVSIVRNGSEDKGWHNLKYLVFDIPVPSLGPVEKRWKILKKIVEDANVSNLIFVPQTVCTGKEQLFKLLDVVANQGGEGIMLRRPGSLYEPKRSGTLLKLKKFIDDEAEVVGYEEIEINTPGKEHLRGAMGCIVCKLKNGVQFSVGSGFSDEQRLSPPKIGSTITFRYQELTKMGVPRFPRFVCIRDYE